MLENEWLELEKLVWKIRVENVAEKHRPEQEESNMIKQ